jgi:sensor histidine kinase YesM
MRIRLQQSVDVQFNISTLNTSVEIAPLLFISLVENAFKHGVSPSEPSFIHIHIESDEHKVVCNIQNSNHPKTADDNSGHGIGLRNVQRRLDLYYPDHYEWVHGPTADGTVFQSRITIIFKD